MKKVREPELVWGTRAIAEVIQLKPRQAYHLMRTGRLPVKKLGATYVGEKQALLQHIIAQPEAAA